MDALGSGIFQSYINWLFTSGGISVPVDYYERCTKIHEMLDDDISGIVNTILDYSVDSAAEAHYKVECGEETLEKLLNIWLQKVNLEIDGIPTGLQALSKEYFKERWQGSSFCILRFKDWEDVTADNVTIKVPMTMWFVNGSSIYVKRPKDKNYVLGTDKYYLDSNFKTEIPENKNESIVVQKPYDRWFNQQATPYLIRKGVYKNWLGIKVLQEKSDEVISKVLPYLFIVEKGTENLMLQGDIDYKDTELIELMKNFKEQVEKYKNEKGKTPTLVSPFDQKYTHLIPDLRNILAEELYRQGFRSILSGLGFVDMLEIAPSRQENRLNPKPFIAEVNSGVSGFKGILLDVIYQIIEKNKASHRKLFSDNSKILIVNNPLRINIDQILEALRSGYDRGVASIQTYQEILGLDYDTEKERREKELNNGDEDLFYPHLIQNREDIPDKMGIPAKPRNEKNEDQNKKKGTPETKTKTAELEDDLEIAPYKNVEELIKKHPYMKKYPKGALEVFIQVFNESLPKGEDYAFPVAYTAMKRWLKKHGYKKVGDKWVKSEEENK